MVNSARRAQYRGAWRVTDRAVWAVYLLSIGACIYFAARASRAVTADARHANAAAFVPNTRASALGLPTTRDVDRIVRRNIFAAHAPAPSTSPPSRGATIIVTSRASDLAVRLIATTVVSADVVSGDVVSGDVVSGDATSSSATLTDASGDGVRVVRVGSLLASDARVVAIINGELLVSRGARGFEHVRLARDTPPRSGGARASGTRRSPAARLRRDALPPVIRDGVRQVGSLRWEIRRRALDAILSNTTRLLRARIVPVVRRGRAIGFRLMAVPADGLYALLGLRSGDTLVAVNGHRITSPDEAMQAYLKLRRASHVVLSLSRGGASRDHVYDVR